MLQCDHKMLMGKNFRRLNVVRILVAAGVLLAGACAQQNVITHVNQRPIFHPSLISYAARDGAVPLEIQGALPAGITAAELAQAVHLPGRTEGVRLIAEKETDHGAPASLNTPAALIRDRLQSMVGTGGHNFRIVLVFNQHFQTLPDKACEAADEIPTSSGQDVGVMAAFCISNHLAASGQVRVPASYASSKGIADAINLLLVDMNTAHPNGRGDTDHRRR